MRVEYNSNIVKDNGDRGNGILITPPIDEDSWALRVTLTENQAIVTFPKFWTYGIGFHHEEDWNTNLRYTRTAREIFNHISHNKGDDSIPDQDCIKAIELIQQELKRLFSNREIEEVKTK